MSIIPIEDKIVVKVLEKEAVTSSGLILTGTPEKSQEAIVIAVGPGITLDSGERIVPDVNVGDKVIFSKYGGTEIEHEGESLIILQYRDIFAVIEEVND